MAASLKVLPRAFDLTQVDHAYTRVLEHRAKRIHLWTIG
jgi:hypothetical protein